MWCVTRKIGQSIVIGDAIEVVVLEVRDEQVRLGVRLPRDVSIHRGEIFEQLHVEPAAEAQPDL